MNKTTEFDSYYDSLEQMSTADLLQNINKEDKTVANTVEKYDLVFVDPFYDEVKHKIYMKIL